VTNFAWPKKMHRSFVKLREITVQINFMLAVYPKKYVSIVNMFMPSKYQKTGMLVPSYIGTFTGIFRDIL
jgi:hypothetical protein